jgi:hypothetical protein
VFQNLTLPSRQNGRVGREGVRGGKPDPHRTTHLSLADLHKIIAMFRNECWRNNKCPKCVSCGATRCESLGRKSQVAIKSIYLSRGATACVSQSGRNTCRRSATLRFMGFLTLGLTSQANTCRRSATRKMCGTMRAVLWADLESLRWSLNELARNLVRTPTVATGCCQNAQRKWGKTFKQIRLFRYLRFGL